MTRISLITACYNSERSIDRTLRSVSRQRGELEHVIQDGGSSDGTHPLVQAYSGAAEHRVVAVSEPELGFCDAINKAIGRATGNISGLINADDWLADEWVLRDVAQRFHAIPNRITPFWPGFWPAVMTARHRESMAYTFPWIHWRSWRANCFSFWSLRARNATSGRVRQGGHPLAARRLHKADVVHQTADIPDSILAIWKSPVVLTIHDLRFIEEASGLNRTIYWYWWLYLPCLRANRVTVISEFTKERLLALCPINPTKVQIISNCVAPEFIANSKPWPAGRPNWLQVGTADNKNLGRVAQAGAGLSVPLTILGQPTDGQIDLFNRPELEYQCRYGLIKEEVVTLYTGSSTSTATTATRRIS